MDLTLNNEVLLEEMLAARERRVFLQNTLAKRYNTTLISFTLNIPGPVKVFAGIPEVFDGGYREILEALAAADISVLHEHIIREKTGYEAFIAADASPLTIKRLMTRLEDGSSIGRLFDIDIIKLDGSKVSREELGLPCRTCLICGQPAHACSRSRNHSVEELIAHIKKIISEVYPGTDKGGTGL
ncbi:citrate lyase holo-[acyl-carrier protein] synthase [Clostridium transplantifaecale]|uniref:citrate lyase holo-[acyl-carrier protein] synthase n=1 Tax=Clostridium transplantifaecale TaxID=2479838 RepID=UPI000F63AF05|nr:citrate lyase holo-[acyl-carrier protein] synthase [Clostridium transplantifaecale]